MATIPTRPEDIDLAEFTEVLNDWHSEALMSDQTRDLDAATLLMNLGTCGMSVVPTAYALQATPAALAAGEAGVAEEDKVTTCRSCEHSNLTIDFGAKCPECGSQDLEHWVWDGRLPAEVLENLLARAAAAHEGPYQVEISGSRQRWFKTNGGSYIFRKLLSEFDLEEHEPKAAAKHRATDTYMAAADPQTVTCLVKEVLALRNALPGLLARLRDLQQATGLDNILIESLRAQLSSCENALVQRNDSLDDAMARLRAAEARPTPATAEAPAAGMLAGGAWVPVAERLPEPKERVLVIAQNGRIQIGKFLPANEFSKSASMMVEGRFCDLDNFTHWASITPPTDAA